MTYDYVAFIDEAGDDGLENIKSVDGYGGTEWFVLAAVVIRRQNLLLLEKAIRDIKIAVGFDERRQLHFKKLKTEQKLIAANKIAELPVRVFVAISNKKNMWRYKNTRAAIAEGQNWYYNFMFRLVLERVTEFCLSKRTEGEGKVRFEFERRGGLNYGHTLDYLRRIKGQDAYRGGTFLNHGKVSWGVVDFSEFHNFRAKKKFGLQASDIVASSFFNALDDDMRDAGNYSFAKALIPRIGRKPDVFSIGEMANFGVKIMPKLCEMKIPRKKKEFFVNFGYRLVA